MRIWVAFAAIAMLGFYSIGLPHGKLPLTVSVQQVSQPKPEVLRLQVTPRLIVITISGAIRIKNLAPKCSLYYGLEGEPLRVGEGVAQVDRNEVKPMSEKILQARGVLSLICALGQAFPVEIQKLSE